MFVSRMMSSRWTTDILLAAAIAIALTALITHFQEDCECQEWVTSRSGSISVANTSKIILIKDCNMSVIGEIATHPSSTYPQLRQLNEHCIAVTHDTRGIPEIKHIIKSGNWYGGPQHYTARWPLSKQPITYQHYVTEDLLARPTKFGSILERYWMSTHGLGLYITNDDVELSYGVENGAIVLGSSQGLEYTICKYGATLKDSHIFMMDTFFKKPTKLPDTAIMEYPIWSTWVRYKTQINQSVIISFAEEIQRHGFKASQLEIDDTYTTNYGDMVFDSARFPDPKQMLEKLKAMNYRVTTWVHPFVNVDTRAFQVGVRLIE